MSSMKRLQALRRIAQIKQDIELARLAALAAEERGIKMEQESLREDLRSAWRVTETAPETGVVAMQFGRWVDQRQTVLAQEAARLSAQLEAQRAASVKALGRAEVMKKLMEKSRNEIAALKSRG
ncbi:hypothetical protein LPB142_00260 [Rhodobacter xanthinilyticus]|uniref:Flagellar export protein FliJ n=1 Tax=Rhodobacter xanthinilyticus TaxID=1850250 RepID=A0A1D9M7V6_9RHOB|nr:hypothetical protein [Rhodobacter xanthinilyticus]AOZ67944.1 hypothetical protein LPB142_00260 [Rhodobacter xanthinilyticus]